MFNKRQTPREPVQPPLPTLWRLLDCNCIIAQGRRFVKGFLKSFEIFFMDTWHKQPQKF